MQLVTRGNVPYSHINLERNLGQFEINFTSEEDFSERSCMDLILLMHMYRSQVFLISTEVMMNFPSSGVLLWKATSQFPVFP